MIDSTNHISINTAMLKGAICSQLDSNYVLVAVVIAQFEVHNVNLVYVVQS
jgi:hypothetical protein